MKWHLRTNVSFGGAFVPGLTRGAFDAVSRIADAFGPASASVLS